MRRPRGVTVVWGEGRSSGVAGAGAQGLCRGLGTSARELMLPHRDCLSSQGPSQGLAPARLPCGCLSLSPFPSPSL